MTSFHSIIISFALTVLGKYKLCKVENEKMKLTAPVFKEFFYSTSKILMLPYEEANMSANWPFSFSTMLISLDACSLIQRGGMSSYISIKD